MTTTTGANSPTQLQYVTVGFWLRLLARLVDVLLVFVGSYIFVLPALNYNTSPYQFRNVWSFYLVCTLVILWILFVFVGVPLLSKGWSLGQKLFRQRVVVEKGNFWKAICCRELFLGFAVAFLALLGTVVINHTLVFKLWLTKKGAQPQLSQFETVRLAIVSTVFSLVSLTQIIVVVSVVLNPRSQGIHDLAANTFVVKAHVPAVLVPQKLQTPVTLRPFRVKNKPVEWVKGPNE